MQPTIKIMMATIIVSLSLVAPGLAGLYEGNVATCKRGDKEMASTLIAKLAKQGAADGQTLLAWMYQYGIGAPHDHAKAVAWYRKAAEQGFAPAQYNLGRIYAVGHGVPQDYTMAHIWFNLAADRKNRNASEVMGLLARDMTPDQIAEAQRLAREWKPAQWMSSLRAFQNALSGCR